MNCNCFEISLRHSNTLKHLMWLCTFNRHFALTNVTADQRWKKWPWRRRRRGGGWEQRDRGGGGEKPQGWQWTSGPYRDGQKRMLRVLVSPGGSLPVKDSAMILFYNDLVKGNRCWGQSSKKCLSSGDEEEKFVKMCELLLQMIEDELESSEPCCWRCSERHEALRETLLCLQCCQWQSSIALQVKRSCCLSFCLFFLDHSCYFLFMRQVWNGFHARLSSKSPFFPVRICWSRPLCTASMSTLHVHCPSSLLGETHWKRMFLWAKVYMNFVDLVLWCVVFQHILITKCKMARELPRKISVWLSLDFFFFFNR